MKSYFKKNDDLMDLSLMELNEIKAGGLLFDFFYKAGGLVGDAINSTEEYLAQVSKTNASKLNSGTYYGR